MWQLKIILLISLTGFISTLCDIDWTPFKDKILVQTQGLSAGLYKKDVPAYIGVGTTTRGLIVPGRLEIGTDKGLRYAANLGIEKTLRNVEFIKQNERHNYTWVSGTSNKCIDNAVTIDDTFYIGRFLSGDFSYIGQVRIGDKGIKYENSQGIQVNGNDYEVLTCSMISETEKYQETKEKLAHCEFEKNNFKDQAEKCENEKNVLSISDSTCKEMLKLYKDNNDLVKFNVANLENKLNECYCTNDNVDLTKVQFDESKCTNIRTQRPSVNPPRPMRPTIIPPRPYRPIVNPPSPSINTDCTNDNVDPAEVRSDGSQCTNKTPQRPIPSPQACPDNSATMQRLQSENSGLKTDNGVLSNKNKKLQNDFIQARTQIEELNKQITSMSTEIVTLKGKLDECSTQPSGQQTCVGANGCINALRNAVLTQDELIRLVMLIKEKGPKQVRDKIDEE